MGTQPVKAPGWQQLQPARLPRRATDPIVALPVTGPEARVLAVQDPVGHLGDGGGVAGVGAQVEGVSGKAVALEALRARGAIGARDAAKPIISRESPIPLAPGTPRSGMRVASFSTTNHASRTQADKPACRIDRPRPVPRNFRKGRCGKPLQTFAGFG